MAFFLPMCAIVSRTTKSQMSKKWLLIVILSRLLFYIYLFCCLIGTWCPVLCYVEFPCDVQLQWMCSYNPVYLFIFPTCFFGQLDISIPWHLMNMHFNLLIILEQVTSLYYLLQQSIFRKCNNCGHYFTCAMQERLERITRVLLDPKYSCIFILIVW